MGQACLFWQHIYLKNWNGAEISVSLRKDDMHICEAFHIKNKIRKKGQTRVLFHSDEMFSVWLILLGCFLLPYFLDTRKEHMFVVLEAGDELLS